ncbi:methyltransferase domain-containing protein [Pedobacter sp. Du54]|uniref:class I SAM-dependent methyltransferase n=1 Tax=Pedobacter anseongensis TaxID=3133439 RepID=UPI0030A9B9B3
MPEINWDSKLYNKQHHFVSDYGADVLQWLAPQQGEHVLDVGCGTGALASQIAESEAIVYGIDASPDMIATAKISHSDLNFEVMDATKLPYKEDFDAIFSNATFHWIENQESLIKGLYTSLKPGGRLVAEFGGKRNIKSITDAISSAAKELELEHKIISNFWFFPSISTYSALLESYGFEVEQIWLFDRPTKLNGENGMYDWINQFAQHAFKNLDKEQAEKIKNLAVSKLSATNYLNNQWLADYRRLRVKAIKR